MDAPHCARPLLAAALCLAVTGPGLAQTSGNDPAPRLGLALNTVSATEAGGCRLTFVIRNDLGAAIDKLVTEAVLFDTEGHVATMTLFDFGTLPEGRPRVRQFDLAGSSCEGIGAVLVNGIGTCEGEGLAPAACLKGLRLSSDTDNGGIFVPDPPHPEIGMLGARPLSAIDAVV